MITYVILFEESRFIQKTYFNYHYYKIGRGNDIPALPEGFRGYNLSAAMNTLEAEKWGPTKIMNQEKASLTAEEIFLNDVAVIYGFYYDEKGDYQRCTLFTRH